MRPPYGYRLEGDADAKGGKANATDNRSAGTKPDKSPLRGGVSGDAQARTDHASAAPPTKTGGVTVIRRDKAKHAAAMRRYRAKAKAELERLRALAAKTGRRDG